MTNINQRIIDEYNQAQTLAALQQARRQLGSEIAAQDPSYFGVNIADTGQPMYPLDNRIDDIYTGADILASDNRVTGYIARKLNDMGVPLAGIAPTMDMLDFTPVGTAEGLYDTYVAAPNVVRDLRDGNYSGAAMNAGIAGLGILDAAASLAPIAGAVSDPVIRAARNLDTGKLSADLQGIGRSIASGDLGQLGEVFQPAGTPRSLSAGSPNITGVVNSVNAIPEESLANAVPFTRSGSDYFDAPRADGGRAKDPALYTPFSTIKQTQTAPSDWEVTGRILTDQLETPTTMTAEGLQAAGFTDMYGFPADATMPATIIDTVNGRRLENPVLQQAGHAYTDYAGRGFASDYPVMTSKNNAWQQTYDEGGKPIVTPMVMGPKGGDFSQHVSQTQAQLIRDAANAGEIDPNFVPKLPENMRGNFVGLLDARLPAYLESLTGGQRGALMKALDTGPAQNAGVPSVAATRFATMDPNLINANLLDSGYRMFQPEQSDFILRHGGDLHSTYTGAVNRVGDSMTMGDTRPWYLMFPDEAGPKMEAATKSGANMLNTNAMPKDLRAFQMNPKLRQTIDNQWVDTNMMYDEILRNEGKAAADQYAYDALLTRMYR